MRRKTTKLKEPGQSFHFIRYSVRNRKTVSTKNKNNDKEKIAILTRGGISNGTVVQALST
jgi:hypothetical protein